jgi:hypothetical protein
LRPTRWSTSSRWRYSRCWWRGDGIRSGRCSGSMKRLCAASLTIFVASASAGAQAPPLTRRDFVVAGVSVGQDSAAVIRVLGRPDSAGTSSDPSQAGPVGSWFYPGLEVLFLGSSVHGAWIRTPRYTTARGLRVGSSAAHARQLYGTPTMALSNPEGLSWSGSGLTPFERSILDEASIERRAAARRRIGFPCALCDNRSKARHA